MTWPAARARCQAMPPGWATDAPAGRAGERTGTDCAGLPVRSNAGRRAERGAKREGPGVRGRWFLAAGAVTGRAVSCTIGIWSPVRAKPRRPWLAARSVRDPNPAATEYGAGLFLNTAAAGDRAGLVLADPAGPGDRASLLLGDPAAAGDGAGFVLADPAAAGHRAGVLFVRAAAAGDSGDLLLNPAAAGDRASLLLADPAAAEHRAPHPG